MASLLLCLLSSPRWCAHTHPWTWAAHTVPGDRWETTQAWWRLEALGEWEGKENNSARSSKLCVCRGNRRDLC